MLCEVRKDDRCGLARVDGGPALCSAKVECHVRWKCNLFHSVSCCASRFNEVASHALAWLLLLLILSCGCSNHAKRLRGPRQQFYGNNLLVAHQDLSTISKKKPGDRTVAELDLAVIELLQGQASSAERRLRSVRDQWDELEQKSLAEQTQVMLTDDQNRKYPGETHERLMVGVFLTLASLMQDGVDAEAYSLQTLMKQQQLVEKLNADGESPVSDLLGVPPIAAYLRGVVREATLHDYDDALRMYHLTHCLLPDHPGLLQDIERAEYGAHSRPGHGVVYVIALVGRGPYKIEQSEPVTQAVLFQADRIVSILGNYSVPPTLAPVKVPVMECPPKRIDLMGVQVNGQPFSTTLPITDIDQLARDTYQAQFSRLMARTVARRIVKKGAVYAAKSQMNANPAASLALDVAGVAWEATESADTRCWGLLPREIQMLRLELPEGEHQLGIEPIRAGRAVGKGTRVSVHVLNARNTYVLGYWPDHEPVGQVLVRTP